MFAMAPTLSHRNQNINAMQAKNSLDQMMEMQNSFFNSWTEMSEQMLKNMSDPEKEGSANEKDLINSWYEKQKDLFTNASKMTTSDQAFKKSPELMKEWWENQMEFSKEWNNLQGKNLSLKTWENFFDQELFEHFKDWSDKYQSMLNDVNPTWKQISITNDLISQFGNYQKAVNQLKDYWHVITKSIEANTYSEEFIKSWFPEDAFKDLLDKLLSLESEDQMKDFTQKANDLFSHYIDGMKELSGTQDEMAQKIKDSFKHVPGVPMTQFLDLYQHLNQQISKVYAPFLAEQNGDKNQEVINAMKNAQFDYLVFAAKSAELQKRMYDGGRKALPIVIKKYADEFIKTKKAPEFEMFFKDLLDSVDEQVTGILKSDDYMKLQKEVSEVGLKIKEQIDQAAEIYFTGIPFASRHDADDLAQEIAALRAQVRDLESKLPKTAARKAKQTA